MKRYRVQGWHHARGMPPQPAIAPRMCSCGHEIDPWHRGGECMVLGCHCKVIKESNQ